METTKERRRRSERNLVRLITALPFGGALILGAVALREGMDFALVEEKAAALLIGFFVAWAIGTPARALAAPRRRKLPS